MNARLALLRPGVSALAGLGALAAHAAAAGRLDRAALGTAAGVALVAAGALAVNQVQEAASDRRMTRTRARPLPSGRLSARTASVQAVLLFTAGAAFLAPAGMVPLLMAAVGAGFYNLVYTPLKRRSGFASLAGTISGAAIPLVGWTAAGGSWAAPGIRWLVAFFVLWQVPHTWLVALAHPGDAQRGGFVPPTNGLTDAQTARVVLVWGAAALLSCAVMPAVGIVGAGPAWAACLLAGAWAAFLLVRALAVREAAGFRLAFGAVNLLAVTVLLALIADRALAR